MALFLAFCVRTSWTLCRQHLGAVKEKGMELEEKKKTEKNKPDR